MLTIDTARESCEHLREEVQAEVEKRQGKWAFQSKTAPFEVAADSIEQQFCAGRQQLTRNRLSIMIASKTFAPFFYIVPLQARHISGCHLRFRMSVEWLPKANTLFSAISVLGCYIWVVLETCFGTSFRVALHPDPLPNVFAGIRSLKGWLHACC